MAITTNSATLICRGNLKSETRRTPSRTPAFYPGGVPMVFPNDCEIEMDWHGNEIRDGGDYVLTVPLGKLMQCLFPALPEKADDGETWDYASVLDEPLWLGPADSFLNIRQNGQPWALNYYQGQRNSLATLLVARQTSWQLKPASPESARLHLRSNLTSVAQTGGEPRLMATSETELTFDRQAGLMLRLETQADVSSQTETSSRHARVSFKARRLTGDELAVALAPPAPAPPVSRKLAGADLEKVTADLRSSDANIQRAAIIRLGDAELDAPAPELTALAASFAFNDDSTVRQSAATFLNNYGTTNETTTLIKLLKDSEDGVCQTAAKALARLQDQRAIVPLTEVLAGGVRMNQLSQVQNFQFLPDIAAALQSFGPAAEEDVAALLDERSIETRHQACLILKQIGTSSSLGALQKVIGDPNVQLNQAAAEAIRAIKQRQ
jgi:HEAT repeat protein